VSLASGKAAGTAPTLASRVASLADSVFGVAMTLLAYDITVPDNRDTRDLVSFLAPKVYALALSFSVAAVYWLNQQRRLGHYHRADPDSRLITLEFVLLFAVVLMPITTRSFVTSKTATIYGANLATLACLNALLAFLGVNHACPPGEKINKRLLVMPFVSAIFFLLVLAQSIFFPDMTRNLWFVAFGLPVVSRVFPSLRGAPDDQT
jgi:uncharacterized membrane protein